MSKFSRIRGVLTGQSLAWQSKDSGNDILTLDGADDRAQVDSFMGYGLAEDATIATGVLTVTKSYVRVLAESGTTDTVDSIVMAGVQDGDMLVLVSESTDTITYDDANIDLAATTRAVAPGGRIVLMYNAQGASWQETIFVAAADNA